MSPADHEMRPQSRTILTKPRAYNWSKPQRVAQKRKKYKWLLEPGVKHVAESAPAITKPNGNVFTPHGIKNSIPDNKEVPTQILNTISRISIVMAAINKWFILPRCAFLVLLSDKTSEPEKS